MTRVLEQCEAVYDIAEACHEATRMAALAWLKALYRPKALLITNGSMWQMKNASGMRRLFKDCAIIDHQCYDDKFGWIEWFNHPGVLASDAFVAVNSRIEDVFLNKIGIAKEKVSLIYHPIDSARIESNLSGLSREQAFARFGLNADQPVVAYVGRLAEQKRPQIFLEVAKIAQDRGDETQFVMVGQGHLSDVIAQQIEGLQLKNISRIENIPLLEEFYIIVDALLITSEYEGVPLAMLEAMSIGVSVVSTDAGDIGRVIFDYQGSQVVPVNSTPLVLYDRLMTVLENVDGVRTRSHESSARVRESFSGMTIGRLYRQVITAAVEKYETLRPF
jgi:glycosyltransferase involved in cell wall biosynthesis